MTHNTQVTPEVFELLKVKQRYVIIKHNPLIIPQDTLVVNQADSRDQLTFEVVSIETGKDSKINGYYSLVGLYAPYTEPELILS